MAHVVRTWLHCPNYFFKEKKYIYFFIVVFLCQVNPQSLYCQINLNFFYILLEIHLKYFTSVQWLIDNLNIGILSNHIMYIVLCDWWGCLNFPSLCVNLFFPMHDGWFVHKHYFPFTTLHITSCVFYACLNSIYSSIAMMISRLCHFISDSEAITGVPTTLAEWRRGSRGCRRTVGWLSRPTREDTIILPATTPIHRSPRVSRPFEN